MTKVLILSAMSLLLLTSCNLTGISHDQLPGEVSSSYAEVAEKLRKKGNYLEAIAAYQTHIENRLADKDRPNDENPYFYQLLIAESFMRLGDLTSAEAAYTVALEQSINTTLIADGFRQIADEYEKQGNYDAAVDILRKHRELDDLLYDAQIDRIHKKSVYESELEE